MQLAPLGKEHRAVGYLTGDGVLEDMAQVRVRRLLGDQIKDGEPLQTRPEITVGKRQVGRQCSPQRLIGKLRPITAPTAGASALQGRAGRCVTGRRPESSQAGAGQPRPGRRAARSSTGRPLP